jgi:CheY-like chemotaxis protein
MSGVEALMLEGSLAAELCAKNGEGTLDSFERPLAVVGHCDLDRARSAYIHILPTVSAPILAATFGMWLLDFDKSLIAQPHGGVAKYHVLVADDNPAVLTLVRHVLNRPAIECQEASDGRQAVRWARQVMPDLIVLDLNMPGLDGFSVLSDIRDDAGIRAAAVMVLTGRREARDIALAEQLGADMYVVKPLQINDFRIRVENLLALQADRGGAFAAAAD